MDVEITGMEYDIEGNPVDKEEIRKRFAGLRPRYYIPFTKTKAEEIIKKSAYTDVNSIRFHVKISPQDYRAGGSALRREITADMFLNWTFDELFIWMTTREKVKPIDWTRASIIQKTADNLKFTPS